MAAELFLQCPSVLDHGETRCDSDGSYRNRRARASSDDRKDLFEREPKHDVESLFSQLPLIATALLVAGLLIIVSGLREPNRLEGKDVNTTSASWIGAVQGLCLPFRGLSRSGATISTGLLLGVGKRRMEEFSFALAVVITPPVSLESFGV